VLLLWLNKLSLTDIPLFTVFIASAVGGL